MTIWFEDFAIGPIARFGSYAVTREEVLAFATAYDPQPFHLSDEGGAANPLFGRLTASGWHTAAMTMRMTVDHWRALGGLSLGSPGLEELRFLKPVFPGDTLSVGGEITAMRPLASKPGIGAVTSRTATFNQHDEAVLGFVATTFWPRRAGGGAFPEQGPAA